MIRPLADIRRFDVFAEYTRLEKRAAGFPQDEAKGYGLWLAKCVAAKKFGRLERKAGTPGPGKRAEAAARKFRALGGVEQTGGLFDKEIVGRMGKQFYAGVFSPAIAEAFEQGLTYREIRDAIRQDWKADPAERVPARNRTRKGT